MSFWFNFEVSAKNRHWKHQQIFAILYVNDEGGWCTRHHPVTRLSPLYSQCSTIKHEAWNHTELPNKHISGVARVFAPQDNDDNNKYRIRCFLVQSLSFPARRRKGGTAFHTHPLAGKFVSEHTGTSYRLLNAGSTFYPYLIRLSVKRERCAIE